MKRADTRLQTTAFIFYVEEVWRFRNESIGGTGDSDEDGVLAVSGRLVEGFFSGPCEGHARLTDDTLMQVSVLGPAKARTSRLERAVTLRIVVDESAASRLRGAYLFGKR